MSWKCALELDRQRNIVKGDYEDLCNAIRKGADLRIETAFIHNQHIDPSSSNSELIKEVSEFRETYLLDDRWTASFMTLRQPAQLPVGFGERPSMSLFMYQQNGQQGIARPYLDGKSENGPKGSYEVLGMPDMPKYHQDDNWDFKTNAPSHNFIYEFEYFKYHVNDEWEEVLAHDQEGNITKGSLERLVSAFEDGAEIKTAIKNPCSDLLSDPTLHVDHEIFIHIGYAYYYTDSKLFMGETHPLVRVAPSIPLRYQSDNWDYGWFFVRTDGFVAMLLCDPYTLKFKRQDGYYPVRWFAR